MNNKFREKVQKSKLQNLKSEEEKLFPLPRQMGTSIKSFRIDNQTWTDFQVLLNKIQELSPRRKISASQLIKALIYLGKESKEEKIINLLRENYL